jgi:hypothetical protein
VKQQSRILFWLLVAATATVDAVAIAWLIQTGLASRAAYLFDALVTGQLAVVSIWAVFAARHMWSSLLAVTVAILVSTGLEVWAAWISARESFGSYAALVAALVAALWILKQSLLWRRTASNSSTRWQFSIGQVLVVMTIVAILLTALRGPEFAADAGEWKYIVAISLCDVLIVLATVIFAIVIGAWWIRLAVDCAVAGTLGALLTLAASVGLLGQLMTVPFQQEVISYMAYAIVISLVLFAWLELSTVLPRSRRADLSPPATTNVD